MIRIGNNINQIARSANAGMMTEKQKNQLIKYMQHLMDKIDVLTTEVLSMRGTL